MAALSRLQAIDPRAGRPSATVPHMYYSARSPAKILAGTKTSMTGSLQAIVSTIKYIHCDLWGVVFIHCKYNQYCLLKYQEIQSFTEPSPFRSSHLLFVHHSCFEHDHVTEEGHVTLFMSEHV